MSDIKLQPFSSHRTRLAGVLTLDTGAHWRPDHEDLALGCECADPALQIEHWHRDLE
ncbi:MAG: hypothetical protein ABIU58_10235 [Ramlibacter sp.]